MIEKPENVIAAELTADQYPEPSFWDILLCSGDKFVEEHYNNPEGNCQKAKSLAKEVFKPDEGTETSWVYDYAEKQYNQVAQDIKDMDCKADALVRYVGVGVALLVVVISMLASSENRYIGVAFIPTIIVSLVVIVCALRAEAPFWHAAPPNATIAMKGTKYHASEEKAKARFAGKYYEATEALKLASIYKSKAVGYSVKAFGWALICLLIPLSLFMIKIFCPCFYNNYLVR